MKRLLILTAATIAALATVTTYAGNAEAGKAKSATCAACPVAQPNPRDNASREIRAAAGIFFLLMFIAIVAIGSGNWVLLKYAAATLRALSAPT